MFEFIQEGRRPREFRHGVKLIALFDCRTLQTGPNSEVLLVGFAMSKGSAPSGNQSRIMAALPLALRW